jgi:hypothetical protein
MPIEISVVGNADLLAGLDKDTREGVRLHLVHDAEQSRVPLDALEGGEHRLEVPSLGAEADPLLVVGSLAADVRHGVDGASATKSSPLRQIHPSIVQPRLGNGLQLPQ